MAVLAVYGFGGMRGLPVDELRAGAIAASVLAGVVIALLRLSNREVRGAVPV